MKRIYLDNAASTPLSEEVFEAMKPYLLGHYGNPSSIHSHGRETRSAIEKARKSVAEHLRCKPAEIFFTSGGTEADNLAITSAVKSYGTKHIITSRIEHHAVLHTIEALEKEGSVQVSYVDLQPNGHIDIAHLENLLSLNGWSLVSLMHANNEIGNITDIRAVGELCHQYGAIFHSDTVQTVGHFPINLEDLKVDFITASAHKFHGPKGAGLIYINSEKIIKPLVYGGGQERNMRGGTENVAGIVGLSKALEIAHAEMEGQRKYIEQLKLHAIEKLTVTMPSFQCNGDSGNFNTSLYTVLNISIPDIEENDMFLFNMDINGISVSGGSACSSGTNIGSHVLDALHIAPSIGTVRISFSKYNTIDEIEYAIDKLAEICTAKA